MRTGNLEFKECVYLGSKPNPIDYEIIRWTPNTYYGKESLFEKQGDWYILNPGDIKIHKNCFKNKESCYTIAVYEYYAPEEIYELKFISDRYLDLTTDEWNILRELIIESDKFLKNELSH